MTEFEGRLARNNATATNFFVRKFKQYGSLFLAAVFVLSLILKGMPLHSLWPLLGAITVITAALLFAKTVQYGGILVGTWWIERDLRRKKQSGSPTEDPDYKPPQPRSGRRRTR